MLTLLELLVAWLGVVVVTSVVVVYLARRWGRDPFGWVLLAAVMGPFAIIALIGTRTRDVATPEPFAILATGAGANHRSPTILAACDGSAASERVARYLASGAAGEGRVTLLIVLPLETRTSGSYSESARRDQQAQIDRMGGTALGILRDAGVAAQVVAGYGVAGEQIVRYARETSPDLIVVGRRGAGLTQKLLGSVSAYVAEHATPPVLVIE